MEPNLTLESEYSSKRCVLYSTVSNKIDKTRNWVSGHLNLTPKHNNVHGSQNVQSLLAGVEYCMNVSETKVMNSLSFQP